MPKLRELSVQFVTLVDDRTLQMHDDISKADGVQFLCPKCFVDNGNSDVGTHSIICWFSGKVGDAVDPKPGRWNPQGTGYDDLTFVPPGAVSVLLPGPHGCGWHGFVRNGEATLS